MTKEEMIEILIEDRINDWVHASNSDELKELLGVGWKGFDNLSIEELQEGINNLCEDNFDDETAEKIKKERTRMELKRIKHLKNSLVRLLEDGETTLTKALGEKEIDLEF